MDTGRLKTIVILILLCVNLAFGGILLAERLGTAEGQAHTRSDLTKVMDRLGSAEDDEVQKEQRDELEAMGKMFSGEFISLLLG